MRFQSFDVTPVEPHKLQAGTSITHKVWPGQRLVIVPDDGSSGFVLRIETNPGEPRPNTRTELEGKTFIGPFPEQRCFRVCCTAGAMVVRMKGKRSA